MHPIWSDQDSATFSVIFLLKIRYKNMPPTPVESANVVMVTGVTK